MISVIYKYLLHPGEATMVPAGEPIHVGPDPHGVPCIWMIHPEHGDPDGRTSEVNIVGTGHRFVHEDLGRFVGSYVEAPFVWHVFLGAPS